MRRPTCLIHAILVVMMIGNLTGLAPSMASDEPASSTAASVLPRKQRPLPTGPFSGVTESNLLDTPHLAHEILTRLTVEELLAHGRGMIRDPEDPQAARVTGQDFSIELEADLQPATYDVAVVVVAPGTGSDSFWVELDGKRDRRPFNLPTGRMGTSRFPFSIQSSGPHRVRLVLREAPGCQLQSVALQRTSYRSPRAPMVAQRRKGHPRLFLTAEELPSLKNRFAAELARGYYRLPGVERGAPPPYSSQRRTCSSFRSMATQAFAQMLEPSPKRLAKQVEWLQMAVSYPHWGHGSLADLDLDAEYMMEGMALAYDWLYHELPEDLRVQVRDCIADHCRTIYTASLAGRTGGGLSFQQNHFWFAHLALGLGAAAIYGEVPEAEMWLGWAFDRFERVFLTLGDDGGFHEQSSYWDYSMPTLFMMIDLYEQGAGLRIPFGDDGLRKAAVYRLHNIYPGLKQTAALGDTRVGKGPPPSCLMLWLARRYGDGVTQGIAGWLPHAAGTQPQNLLWLDETLAPQDPQPAIPVAHRYPDIQMAFARSSWQEDATMFAFISRPLGGEKWARLCRQFNLGGSGHNHPAQNHFVLFGRGSVLAADPGYTYEKKTGNHNTILVDGQGQLGDGQMWPVPNAGRARITRFTAERGICLVTGEAASAYPEELNVVRFERTLGLIGSDLVVVYDRVAARQDREFSWRLHFYGQAERHRDAWLMTAGQAQLGIVPLLPSGVAGTAVTESPVYIHPTRDLTPETPHINLLELTTDRTKEATFLVLLFIGERGTQLPTPRHIHGPGFDAAQVGDTIVAFSHSDGQAMEVPLASGKTLTTSEPAVVARVRQDGELEVLHHRGDEGGSQRRE